MDIVVYLGSCSTLFGDNESHYLETFMIYCKHERLCLFPYNYGTVLKYDIKVLKIVPK